MSPNEIPPVALTIAGSDSGGGAGIQADLRTFAALGTRGVVAVSCLTAQNPRRVLGIEPCRPEFLRLQLEAVFSELPPAAAKTGMLYSAELVRTVADFLRGQKRGRLPLVVDPVMVATSGAPLMQPGGVQALVADLLPLATLITPNLAEAASLAGHPVRSPEEMRGTAKELCRKFGCAVLVKGGHLRGYAEAVDILFDGQSEWLLSAPYIQGLKTHGTGCTYSAGIAAGLARGLALPEAVRRAKSYLTGLLLSADAGRRHPR